MTTLGAFVAGVLAGSILGVLAGAAFGRHDDRGLVPWWVRVEL